MNESASHNRNLGPALRAIRQERGISLRELAKKVGMHFSTLSKIENGNMVMTFDKLVAMAQGLEVDISRLVMPPEAEDVPLQATGRRSITLAGAPQNAASERYHQTYVAPELLRKMMSPIIIDVQARSVEEVGGLIRHAGEEYLYVLKGAIELHSDLYTPLLLQEGDSIYFDSGMAHCYTKVGEGPCKVLTVCAGPGMRHLAQAASGKA